MENIIITDIEEPFTVNSPAGRRRNIKNRRVYGLTFCISGKITYTHKGNKYISLPDTAIILPQNATYTLYNNEGGIFPVINFRTLTPFTDSFIVIPIKHNTDYIKDYETLQKLTSVPNGRMKAMSILYDMFDRLFSENTKSNPIIDKVIPYIESRLGVTELSNSQIAEAANISESYLRRKFVQVLGTTPKQYILERRIKSAKIFLTETDKKISELSYECGFSSIYHFCRAFRNKTGMTPSEYRELYQSTGLHR